MTAVTNHVGDDGFGSQYQRRFAVALFSEIRGNSFRATPFKNLPHTYGRNVEENDSELWKLTGLDNAYERSRGNEEIIKGADAYKEIRMKGVKALDFSDTTTLKKFREAFCLANPKPVTDVTRVVYHYRISNKDDGKDWRHLISFNTAARQIKKLKKLYPGATISVLGQSTQGGGVSASPADFDVFRKAGALVHLDRSLEDDFREMVHADVLVIAKSSFSYIAGILNEGTVYYNPFWHPPLVGWKEI
jgi:hypothetical protein